MKKNMWKLISYSLSLSIIFVSFSYYFYDSGGYKFTEVGGYLEGISSLIILMVFTKDDELFRLPQWTEVIFNIVLYGTIIFSVLAIVTQIPNKKSSANHQ